MKTSRPIPSPCVDTGKGAIAVRGTQAPDKGLHFCGRNALTYWRLFPYTNTAGEGIPVKKTGQGYLGYPIGYFSDVTLFAGGKKDTHNELDPLPTR